MPPVSGYSSLEGQVSEEKVANGGLCATETLWEELGKLEKQVVMSWTSTLYLRGH